MDECWGDGGIYVERDLTPPFSSSPCYILQTANVERPYGACIISSRQRPPITYAHPFLLHGSNKSTSMIYFYIVGRMVDTSEKERGDI